MEENYYQTPNYLLNPNHSISIAVIGCGGTGSHLLMGLAAMSNAAKAIGHPGFYVRAFDDDIVESHNVGRQFFSNPDVGLHKSTVLITRINRMFGIKWESVTTRYNSAAPANIVFTCVDSIKSRKQISLYLEACKRIDRTQGYEKMYLWFDCGNDKETGQIVIGSLHDANFKMLNFFERYPGIKSKGDPTASCSMMEALNKQELFINKTIALYAGDLFWKMLRTGKIYSSGMYINHKSYQTSEIPING